MVCFHQVEVLGSCHFLSNLNEHVHSAIHSLILSEHIGPRLSAWMPETESHTLAGPGSSTAHHSCLFQYKVELLGGTSILHGRSQDFHHSDPTLPDHLEKVFGFILFWFLFPFLKEKQGREIPCPLWESPNCSSSFLLQQQSQEIDSMREAGERPSTFSSRRGGGG